MGLPVPSGQGQGDPPAKCLIISPAKKMNVDTDTMEIRGLPRFLNRTSCSVTG